MAAYGFLSPHTILLLPSVTKTDLFARCAACQTLRSQGLQPRKSLLTRQPSQKTGKQVSKPPTQKQGRQHGLKHGKHEES